MFSFATVYTTVIVSNVLLILATCVLRKKTLLQKVGYPCFGMLLALMVIRLALPFEFFFTRTFLLPERISRFIQFFHYEIFSWGEYIVSPWEVLKMIWGCGIVIRGICWGRRSVRTRRCFALSQDMTKEPLIASVLTQVCSDLKCSAHVQVISLEGINSPMVFGIFAPRILLPVGFVFSKRELTYIISHEILHYLHGDVLMNWLLQLLTVLYWWNPACYILLRQGELLFELRVDDQIVCSGDNTAVGYMECLYDVAAQAVGAAGMHLDSVKSGIGAASDGNLTMRFSVLMQRERIVRRKRSLQAGLVGCTLSICVMSYLFIFEAGYVPPEIDGTIQGNTIEEYFIKNESGTYDIYFHMIPVETVAILPEGMPVFESMNDFDCSILPNESKFAVKKEDGTWNVYCHNLYVETVDNLDDYYWKEPIYQSEEERVNALGH